MQYFPIYLAGVAISIGILYFVISLATKTDKKIDLLAKIEAKNSRIEVMIAHFISTQPPQKRG